MHDEADLDLRVGTTDGAIAGLHRVVDAASLAAPSQLERHRRGLLTGLSIVVVSVGLEAAAQVAAATEWAPPEFRVEFVLGDPDPALTERLDQLAWSWSSVALPHGRSGALDVAAALDVATAQSGGEFVVVASAGAGDRPAPSFRRLGEALGVMWVNGADAMIIDEADVSGVDATADDAPAAATSAASRAAGDGRAERLSVGLGLRRGAGPTLVVLRRWVARFLFDEIAHAIDPVEELTERVRLLELRLLEVRGPS